jgi:predicted nucleotide-binding protein
MKQAKEKRIYLSQEDVPAFSLEEALRIPRIIFENFGKQPPAPIQVASALKLAPRGNQFQMLTGASIAYGFTTGGYNATSIIIQPLAKRILAPTDEGDDMAAQREAFMRPRITKEFVERYNKSPLPKDDIGKNVLVELGVPRDRAAGVLQTIIESAEKLGLIQEIKTKKYLFVDAPISTQQNEEANSEIETGVLPRAITPIATPAVSTGNGHQAPATIPFVAATESLQNRRVFITHGKNKAFVDPIKKLLQFGELEAVVSVDQQSVSQPVPDKVMNDMRSCGAAIIHVSDEWKLMDSEAKEHVILNPNVLIEIGAAIALYGRRFILLVKDGVKLPSNLQGLYEVRYSGETLDGDVTIRLMEAINALKKTPSINKLTTEN